MNSLYHPQLDQQANSEKLPPTHHGIHRKRTFNHILISGYEKPKQYHNNKSSSHVTQIEPNQLGDIDSIFSDENILSSTKEGDILSNLTSAWGLPATSISPDLSTPGDNDRKVLQSNANISPPMRTQPDDSRTNGIYFSSMPTDTDTTMVVTDECQLSLPLVHNKIPNKLTSHNFIPDCYTAEKSLSSSASMGIDTQSASDLSQISRDEFCSLDLKPATVPHNLLDDEWETTPALTKELAWIAEESLVLLPSEANISSSHIQSSLPILIAFAWKHGSLELRHLMWETYTSKRCALVKALNNGDIISDAETVDGTTLLKSWNDTKNERLVCLRKEAHNALQLGFRRSDSIDKELNIMCAYKFREAVEEVGESGIGNRPIKSRRLKMKSNIYEELLQSALEDSTTDADIVANIPSSLNPLEEELAWLVEESLILLPRGMIDNTSQSNSLNGEVTETVISAGSISKSKEIDWDYVERNASSSLKDALERIGGINRRPLQRLVRTHDSEVIGAFQVRREDVATLLLLRGYRREETRLSLPSHELLVHTGLDKVWSVRLARRRQIHGTPKSVASLKRQRISSPKKERVRSSILTVEEEEIAWVSSTEVSFYENDGM